MNDYKREWQQYRFFRNCALAFYLSIVLAPIWARFLTAIPWVPPRISLAIWAILLVLIEVRLLSWRCTRCKQWYFVSMKQSPPTICLWPRYTEGRNLPRASSRHQLRQTERELVQKRTDAQMRGL